MKKLVIFGNRRQEEDIEEIGMMLRGLADIGFSMAVRAPYLERLRRDLPDLPVFEEFDTVVPDADLALSIGGDGTFLRTARRIGQKGIPILGVNTGHLGFLTQYSLRETGFMLSDLQEGNLQIEKRMLLEVGGDSIPRDTWRFALNEVSIIKEDTASMINVRAEINGNYLADYLGDGLVISTPTGSTAYNLSAGGPLMEPTLGCMVLSPVAPHTLTLRPLVVSGDSLLRLHTSSRSAHYRLSLDGISFPMECGSEISIGKARFDLNLVRRIGNDFGTTLRKKLLWSQR